MISGVTLKKATLKNRLPSFSELSSSDVGNLILNRFLEFIEEAGLSLYAAQEEAILALYDGHHVILNTPTGSGKSLVAEALVFHSLALGKKTAYTCPVKALVNEKFLRLCQLFGAENIGLITGDGAVNAEASVICCTAEILANTALREGESVTFDDVVMDEFHYYSDRERGISWQIPLLEMKNARFLLMSATLGQMDFFSEDLYKRTGREVQIITGLERPVPLEYEYRSETQLHETVSDLLSQNKAPIYLVNFTQNLAAEQAQNLMSIDVLTKEQKKEVLEELKTVSFRSPYGKEIAKFLKHGIGVHHAGLLPKYRILVERLAQKGLLKIVSGTDTLGVGVNIPIRTVLLSKLCKFDGQKTTVLSSRDFHQISGRAGRRGFDDKGFVVCQAPEHVIENLKLERKAAGDPKKQRKLVKAKPPERGYVHWDEGSFQKLIKSEPEPLKSVFYVDHGMVLSVLGRRSEDGCEALRGLIRKSHESEAAKKKHRRRAFQLFRSLLERGVIALNPLRVSTDLQADFSLHQSLSLWLLDTLEKIDPESESYALDVITLCESIVESPDLIIRKQVEKARQALYLELKEQGIEFEERQERLESVEHPKPLRDFIYQTFNEWSDRHPWVGGENIRPKSVVREIFENGYSFADYIREYSLQRGEGTLLRNLSDVYKVLLKTVPIGLKDERLLEMETDLRLMIQSVDSSLLDEWEGLKNEPESKGQAAGQVGEGQPRQSSTDGSVKAAPRIDEKVLSRRLRVEAYRFLRALASNDLDEALLLIEEWKLSEFALRQIGLDESLVFKSDLSEHDIGSLLESIKGLGFSGIRTDLKARAPDALKIVWKDATVVVNYRLFDLQEEDLTANLCFEFFLRNTAIKMGEQVQ